MHVSMTSAVPSPETVIPRLVCVNMTVPLTRVDCASGKSSSMRHTRLVPTGCCSKALTLKRRCSGWPQRDSLESIS